MAGHGFLIDRVTTCLCRRWAAALPDGHRRRRGRLRAVHLHPGGQGFWIARLVAVLGIEARLVSPIGGEAGDVLQALVPQWEVELHALPASITSPTRVHDRRSGERLEILEVEEPTLDRHDANDLYSITLETALTSAAVVLTAASGGLLDAEAYRRLVTDLNAQQIPIFADLHDDPLAAALEGGRLDLLKVSEEDLRDDGWAMGSEKQSIDATRELVSRGADMVQSVIHSGTVGAALTALTFGAHGLAVSLDPSDPWHWGTAAQLAVATAGWIMSAERQPLTLNLNSPSVPVDQVLGLRMAELDGFGYFRVAAADESGQKLQLEMSGEGEITETEGSDTWLLRQRYATITVLGHLFGAGSELPGDLGGIWQPTVDQP